jgi:uncharacterized protein (TIGR03000 family)
MNLRKTLYSAFGALALTGLAAAQQPPEPPILPEPPSAPVTEEKPMPAKPMADKDAPPAEAPMKTESPMKAESPMKGEPAEPAKLPEPKAVPVVKAQPAPAVINVKVPANATVWIEEQKMTATGPSRNYQSPPLEPGKTYAYTFKLAWPTGPGQPDFVTQQEITIRAGQTTTVDFTPLAGMPSAPQGQVIMPAGVKPGQPQPAQPVQPARGGFFRR